ncbi:MAG: hypothetical protein ACOYJA_03930 [Christensenellales bacterium]|jgi:hypothetical protein
MHPDIPNTPPHRGRTPATWTLRDPAGKLITVRNLQRWAREHCELFGMQPCERSAVTIAVGLRNLKRSALGKLRRKDGTPYTIRAYKGWTLVGWEEPSIAPGSAPDARG